MSLKVSVSVSVREGGRERERESENKRESARERREWNRPASYSPYWEIVTRAETLSLGPPV